MKLAEIKSNPNNPRLIRDDKFRKLVKSIEEFPKMMALRPMVINADNIVLGGNMRLKALKDLGYKDIPDEWVKRAEDLTEEETRRFIIADNVGFGEHDWEMLKTEWDIEELSEWGLDMPVFEEETENEETIEQNKKLSERFIIPPFSVLDTKQGAWQQRKNYWLSLGIKSEEGRDAECLQTNFNEADYGVKPMTGTSIFDPVLCELAYQWFNVPNGKILDCFAGGSVRGIVAAKLGFQYLGNDLSEKQILANRNNAVEVLQDAELYPSWNVGDSLQIDKIANGYEADMIFSCPPYADLEVYSDAKEDISNMPYKQFIEVYREIIRKSCQLLKEDRFAVFVVGDVRDKKGFYQNFVSDTIQAFIDSGVLLYNEMILVNAVGSLAIRAGRQFAIGRKVGKQHQNVLVFYKGNPKNIKANYPELDLSYIEEQNEE
jgi:16S rRNA G966 N2-methylase RsmD